MIYTEPNNPTPRQKLNAQPIAKETFFSVDSSTTGCSALSVLAAKAVAAAALSRNSQCQDQVSVIQPPTTGPTVGASTAIMPAIVVAIGCRRIGNSRKTAENTAGINAPPANP